MIELDGIDVSYGNIQVIWDLDLHVSEDDAVVSIVGPNGAGKSTLLKVMSGLHPVDDGRVTVWGSDAADLDPTDIVERGFVHVSEERNLFGDMTVRENLEMGAYTHRDGLEDTIREVYELFPILEERSDQLATSMSGGQQQMLAIGRGLMAQPKILALDEPSEGLAPQITDRVFEKIEAISEEITVLLIEQHVNRALKMAQRAYLLENGRVVREDTGTGLLESDHVKEAYL
ncbi:ATP-binding cassette domain-containing protein [Halobellus ruber]|uniref:ABC transporter ATP-binding protein n=1 Tax=Halobellus ruber TaxID=2761102 RepID=A0A7J9SI32_9EURY|nr:ABC transporter ATP-binding protein [Halobellus ruber]